MGPYFNARGDEISPSRYRRKLRRDLSGVPVDEPIGARIARLMGETRRAVKHRAHPKPSRRPRAYKPVAATPPKPKKAKKSKSE